MQQTAEAGCRSSLARAPAVGTVNQQRQQQQVPGNWPITLDIVVDGVAYLRFQLVIGKDFDDA
jgi:hypothetical protein